MILLRRQALLFVKGAKVAGTSIEVLLGRHAREDDIVTPIFPASDLHVPRNHLGPDGSPRFYNHIDAAAIRTLLGAEYFHGLRRFGVVRHPVEKVRSTFAMQYVRREGKYDVETAIADTWSEAEKYCDRDGSCLLTDVLRYERLETELGRLLSQVGVPFDGLSIREKGEYRKLCPVEPVFEPEHYALIMEKFAWEFANFYAREILDMRGEGVS
jgi:hypothetical protein